MCGIVGFYGKTSKMREALGRSVAPMLVCMGDRGPDSTGLAVFSDSRNGNERSFSLYSADRSYGWQDLAEYFESECGAVVEWRSNHAVMRTDSDRDRVAAQLREHFPHIHLLCVGKKMNLYKDTGHPSEIVERYGLSSLQGSHCVGHTRMATESAVTPFHSHPFVAGEDFCIVHNGSLSNHHSLRRRLEKEGIQFETDNDTEAVCRLLQWRMREGDSIEEALQRAFFEVDGFYTLLIGTEDRLVLVRDAFACKPAVAAETAEYVAVGSEFRTLAHLPGIRDADLFEPAPEKIYSWNVST